MSTSIEVPQIEDAVRVPAEIFIRYNEQHQNHFGFPRFQCLNLEPQTMRDRTEPDGSPFRWLIDVDSVPLLPEIYPHVRNPHTFQDISADVVSLRISNFLRLNSICCKYNSKSGGIVCSTTKVPKFIIQLWRRPNDSKKKIILETQRRQGCSVALSQVRKALIRSIATGQSQIVQSPLRIGCSIPGKVARSMSGCRKRTLELAMDSCIRLLESNCDDQTRLGMESLNSLTDPSIVDVNHANIVARAFLWRRGIHGGRLQNAFKDCLLHHQQEDGQRRDFATFPRLALLALGNSLLCFSEKRIGEDYMTEFKKPQQKLSGFWRIITKLLVESIKDARRCPQNAALASRSIRILETYAPEEQKPFRQFESLPSLVHLAHEYGKAYHASLEEETFTLLRHIL
jgi:hypothetical protein